MFSLLPLDDQLNRIFYVDGSLCRLVYSRPLGRCVLQQEVSHIAFDYALTLITSGELLWTPPDVFERPSSDTPLETVQRECALLSAYLRSPSGHRIASWKRRRWFQSRLEEMRDWTARRMFAHDDVDEPGGQDRRSA
jgi:hypothetical protein